MLNFNFRVERSKDCILIDSTNWIENTSNSIQKYRLSGRAVVTYITEVLDTNFERQEFKESIKKGDTVLLSRIVSEVSQYRKYGIGSDKRYFNAPAMQVMGVFEGGEISFDTFYPILDKLLIRTFTPESDNFIKKISDNTTVGTVVKAGSCRFSKNWEKKDLQVRVGDTVLVKDNIGTKIELNGTEYLAVEESAVVGIFKDNLDLDSMTFINESVLLSQYVPEKLSKTSVLYTPVINYEDLDYSDIYNPNTLKVEYIDPSLTKVKKGDIILIDRNVTSYVYFNDSKYFIINGMDYVEGKLN